MLAVAVLLPLFLVLGIWLGGHPRSLPGFVRGRLVGDSDTRIVREAIDRVHDSYYRPIPRKQLADAAIRGVVSGLHDRFSQYLTPTEYAHLRLLGQEEFSGVGMTVSPVPDGLRVAQVFDDSPARRAGIRPGDIIVAAAGKSLRGRSQAYSVSLIQGPSGSDVRLTYVRDGRRHAVSVTRATLSVPVVASSMREVDGRRLGIVKLADFSSGAHAEVDGAVRKLLRRHVGGIVFDLRGNGGGLVREAQLVASVFLRDGPVVTTRGRDVPSRTLNAGAAPLAPKLPLVVLVDRDTASASEIVTGAFQDRHRATVVGTRTFGKGVFQELIRLSNGGALDITAGQYFTPGGRNLGGKGVTTGEGIVPDVFARDDPATQKRDEGLDRALQVLARHVPR